jgi:hypothetical protein
MNVEATKGGCVLITSRDIERFVGAIEKLADAADRAVRLAEYKQDRFDMSLLEQSFPRTPEEIAEVLVRQKQFRERHR